MSSNTYRIKRGEQYPIKITVRDNANDVPIDLTGSTILWQIKDELKDEYYTISKTITEDSDETTVGRITDPENGIFVVRFTDDDYSNLILERVYYLVITWVKESENFKKIISSEGCDSLRFIMCTP